MIPGWVLNDFDFDISTETGLQEFKKFLYTKKANDTGDHFWVERAEAFCIKDTYNLVGEYVVNKLKQEVLHWKSNT